MTMFRGIMALSVAVALPLLLCAVPARADDDTVRLGTSIESKTANLPDDGQSETTLIWGGVRGFGGVRVGFRPVFGARFRPFFGTTAFRPFFGAAVVRPGWGWGGGWGWNGGWSGGWNGGIVTSPVIWSSPFNNCN